MKRLRLPWEQALDSKILHSEQPSLQTIGLISEPVGFGTPEVSGVGSKHTTYIKRNLARFEVSVWSGQELCGVCYGRPSRGKTKLGLNLIESTPIRPTPFGGAVFPVISLAATLYALAIGAEELCILDPINAKVTKYYMSNGFSEPYIYHGKRIALRSLLYDV